MNFQKSIFQAPIYILSGGRGIAGNNLVQSLLIQYPDNDIPVVIIPHVVDKPVESMANEILNIMLKRFSCRGRKLESPYQNQKEE